jgi:hypothetical protein
MPKMITITARTRPTTEFPEGQEGEVQKLYPLNLAEAVQMHGELEVFKGFIRDRVIIDQRDARPVADSKNSDTPKPKKRLSVMDRLSQD